MTDSTIRFVTTERRVPKRGNSLEEYEDSLSCNPERWRFAIADGATESSYAGDWAKLLTEHFIREPRLLMSAEPNWNAWLAPLQKKWCEAVDGQARSWYAEAKVEIGAYATFLGLIFSPKRSWRAVAVGDCCLFQIRGETLVKQFPIGSSGMFSNHPRLLGSRSPAVKVDAIHLESREEGDWRGGDRFLLMTDMLAARFLEQVEESKVEPSTIADSFLMFDEQGFAEHIEGLRDAGLHNDDVTFLHIAIEDDGPEIPYAQAVEDKPDRIVTTTKPAADLHK